MSLWHKIEQAELEAWLARLVWITTIKLMGADDDGVENRAYQRYVFFNMRLRDLRERMESQCKP